MRSKAQFFSFSALTRCVASSTLQWCPFSTSAQCIKAWGHAISRDLLHWTHLAPALLPNAVFDVGGVWSGSALLDPATGKPFIMYTGVNSSLFETQNIAFPIEDEVPFISWVKNKNPVISSKPAQLEISGGFRDPNLLYIDNKYHLNLGTAIKVDGKTRGAILTYFSTDKFNWTFNGILTHDATGFLGYNWECPDLFPLKTPAGKEYWILLFSDDEHRTMPYIVGQLDQTDMNLKWITQGHFDAGQSYAQRSLLDGAGRRISHSWVIEDIVQAEQEAQGWSGSLSLPRVLSLDDSLMLEVNPAQELESLRTSKLASIAAKLISSQTIMGNISCLSCDVDISMTVLSTGTICAERSGPKIFLLDVDSLAQTDNFEYGVVVRAMSNLTEATFVKIDSRGSTLTIDRSRSSLSRFTGNTPVFLSFRQPLSEIRLRIFIDASVLEVFVNELYVATARVYPTSADANLLGFFAGPASSSLPLVSITGSVYQMTSTGT